MDCEESRNYKECGGKESFEWAILEIVESEVVILLILKMHKYIGEEQYAMNRWGYFREKKISQFFSNQLGRHYKRKQFYLGILDVFLIVIVRFMMKREERLIVTALILVMIKMVMNYKFNW